jgi:hypothetical protein
MRKQVNQNAVSKYNIKGNIKGAGEGGDWLSRKPESEIEKTRNNCYLRARWMSSLGKVRDAGVAAGRVEHREGQKMPTNRVQAGEQSFG